MARPRKKKPFEVIAIHRPRSVRMTTNTQDGEDQKVMREDDGNIVYGPKTVFATSRRAATLRAYQEIVKLQGAEAWEPDDLDIRVREFHDDGGGDGICCDGEAENW